MTLHYLFNTGLYRSNGKIIPTLATTNYLLTVIYTFIKNGEYYTGGLCGSGGGRLTNQVSGVGVILGHSSQRRYRQRILGTNFRCRKYR